MKNSIKYIIIVSLLLLSRIMLAQTTGEDLLKMSTPNQLVNDYANIFSASEKRLLEQKLVDFDNSTSNQIAIVTIESLSNYDISDLAFRVAEKWGVGHKENNGVLILMKPKMTESDRGRVFIAVGYGLEDVIPDAISKRIVENEMIPYFKLNDYYNGFDKATDVLADLASGKYSSNEYIKQSKGISPVLIIIIILIIIFILSRNKSSNNDNFDGDGPVTYKRPRSPWIFFPGGFGGGGGSYGGSGGFGGFGGGSFGGGGAGGSW